MFRLWLAVLLALLLALIPSAAGADTGLTDSIAAAYFPRTVDARLHDLAHKRAAEIVTDYGHRYLSELDNGQWAGWGEVIGWNTGYSDPEAAIVSGWRNSPPHNAILSDRSYTAIGCAEAIAGLSHYFACVLAAPRASVGPSATPRPTLAPVRTPSPTRPAPVRTHTPLPPMLPNTSI
jgi:hypothetical protein